MDEEKKTVECILRIQPSSNFNRDIKVLIPEDRITNGDDSWSFTDIYNGASQTLLHKYLPQMKMSGTKIFLYRPIELSQSDFVEFTEESDVNKASADIMNILNGLPKEKREKLIKQLNL